MQCETANPPKMPHSMSNPRDTCRRPVVVRAMFCHLQQKHTPSNPPKAKPPSRLKKCRSRRPMEEPPACWSDSPALSAAPPWSKRSPAAKSATEAPWRERGSGALWPPKPCLQRFRVEAKVEPHSPREGAVTNRQPTRASSCSLFKHILHMQLCAARVHRFSMLMLNSLKLTNA